MDDRGVYVLGLDSGATHTLCLVADETGMEVGRGLSGPSNHQAVGVETARRSLAQAIAQARQAAGDPPLAAACWGMAGLDRESDRRILNDLAAELLPGVPVTVVHDSEIALASATGGQRIGVVVIAGTGSIAVGYGAEGRTARAGGWGHLLGDEGSGFDLVRRALNAATRALDGRGPATSLVERLPQAAGMSSMDALADRLYLESWSPDRVAALAPAVLAAADEGDGIARKIVDECAEELALAAESVIRSLGIQGECFDVVLSGGILKASPRMVEGLRARLVAEAPRCRVAVLQREPVWGAVRLALLRVAGS